MARPRGCRHPWLEEVERRLLTVLFNCPTERRWTGGVVGRWLLSLSIAAMGLGGCGPAPPNPGFERVEVTQVFPDPRCPPDRSCVEVRARVVGSRVGEGSCRIFGPGDPESLVPLDDEDIEMRPSEVAVWSTDVPSNIDVEDLQVICRPMSHG